MIYSFQNKKSETRYWVSFVLASVVLGLAIWLSSGTMSPYAITLGKPKVLAPCGYLGNMDHDHFKGTFLMLNGAPPETWNFSVVLRRIIFPIVSYPFMKIWGFYVGGFVCSLLLNLTVFAVFVDFTRRRFGVGSAVVVQWLLATYPGIPYWAGLPYSYTMIVPGTLLGVVLLFNLEAARRLKGVLGISFGFALIFLAYDLMPFFVPAALWILWKSKNFKKYSKVKAMFAFILGMLIPQFISYLTLKYGYGTAFVNSNTSNYLNIFRS